MSSASPVYAVVSGGTGGGVQWKGYAQCTHGAHEATQVALTVLLVYYNTTPLLCTDARSIASQPPWSSAAAPVEVAATCAA